MNRCLISLLKNTLSKLNCLVITYIFNQNNWIFEKILKKHFPYIVVLKASGVGKGTLAPMPAPTIQWVFRKYLMYTIKYHFSFFFLLQNHSFFRWWFYPIFIILIIFLVVIDAVEIMLARYDFKLSNRSLFLTNSNQFYLKNCMSNLKCTLFQV